MNEEGRAENRPPFSGQGRVSARLPRLHLQKEDLQCSRGFTYGDELRPKVELQLRAERLAEELRAPPPLEPWRGTGEQPLVEQVHHDESVWPVVLAVAAVLGLLHLALTL